VVRAVDEVMSLFGLVRYARLDGKEAAAAGVGFDS
jgi:hypothetical protein